MNTEFTTIGGLVVPSASPVFLGLVATHVLVALAASTSGPVAMLSSKRRGRHSRAGTVYYWCLIATFDSATALSLVRWAEDYPPTIVAIPLIVRVFLRNPLLRAIQ